MSSWERIEPTTRHQIGWLTVISKTFVLPDGRVHSFEVIAPENSHEVAVIPLTVDHKVIIARQFRPGPEKVMEQLPGGGFEPEKDRTMIDAARRELREETGYLAGDLEHIGTNYRSAYSNAKSHYYLATNCQLSSEGTDHDEFEIVEPALITINQLLDNARNARMTDVAGVFLAYDRLAALAVEHV
jgi:ADP-ribose pyrophosphatase